MAPPSFFASRFTLKTADNVVRGERRQRLPVLPLKMCWSPRWPWGIMCSYRLPSVLT